ncbi:MAG: hypothetical protein IH623_18180 [Verrucomicrobia bacterium]|nr:hypothetical protein [Verrucomicrobiota bacterium]
MKTTKRTTKTSATKTSAAPGVETKTAQPTRSINPGITIEARIDVGYGNNLFLRGQGGGLSWERGIPLKCLDGQTWQWSGKVEDNVKFKLLLNDCVWSQGDDFVAAPGQRLQVTPAF